MNSRQAKFKLERLKARFIAEYAALCQRHGLMVIQDEVDRPDGGTYAAFAVADITGDERALPQALEEMRIEELRFLEPE